MPPKIQPSITTTHEIQTILERVSHDLGAPIRTAKSFSKLLSKKYQNHLDETAQEWLDYIDTSTQKAQTLLDGLVKYSHIFSNQQTPETFILQKAFNAALIQHQHVIEQSHAKITAELTLSIFAIKQHWETLFTQLLKNSLCYQPPEQQPIIKTDCKLDSNNDLTLRFEDNGIGVDEQHYQKLPIIFSRLHTDITYPGIGLGLALCQRILQYYAGNIRFDRSSLGGLAVIAYLPNCGKAITEHTS